MQHKLATWARDDQTKKFDRLLQLIANRDWLAEAARIVLSSNGAKTAGIDGMSKRSMQRNLDSILETLRHELVSGTYVPKAVKRIYIPKANGKLRPLGIPTVASFCTSYSVLLG
jgi:RNA-directed DNA polymerase